MSDLQRDLVVLVADRQMEAGVSGILSRCQALGVRDISHEVYVHPERDPGCFLRGHEFLRELRGSYAYGLVMFDRAGCGQSSQSREQLEETVEERLWSAGWRNRAAAVVLDPELEVWIWSDSPELAGCLGWGPHYARLRSWLSSTGNWPEDLPKPPNPKATLERAMREARKPRTSSVFKQAAERVSFQRCRDPAFSKLVHILQRWFPSPSNRD